mmetsp:Transcript_11473/g.29063  ORF Transcript_11473/g.29063 Transcript_11473/m.29063 type:complete len:210 (+) Transcript_11473:657-1286(+)
MERCSTMKSSNTGCTSSHTTCVSTASTVSTAAGRVAAARSRSPKPKPKETGACDPFVVEVIEVTLFGIVVPLLAWLPFTCLFVSETVRRGGGAGAQPVPVPMSPKEAMAAARRNHGRGTGRGPGLSRSSSRRPTPSMGFHFSLVSSDVSRQSGKCGTCVGRAGPGASRYASRSVAESVLMPSTCFSASRSFIVEVSVTRGTKSNRLMKQ